MQSDVKANRSSSSSSNSDNSSAQSVGWTEMLLGPVRDTVLQAVASLCALTQRRLQLPSEQSSLEREWRLGLYEALRDASAQFYGNACDLNSLFEPGTLQIYSGSQKASMSDSVIMAGVLRAPTNPDVARRYASVWQRYKCDVILKVSFPALYERPKAFQLDPLTVEVRLYEFLSVLVAQQVTPNLMLGLGVFDCSFYEIETATERSVFQQFSREARAVYQSNGKLPKLEDKVRFLLLERGRGSSLGSLLDKAEPQIEERQLLSLLFQVLFTLDALDARNIRHGDLHDGNVWVDRLSDRDTTVAYMPFFRSSGAANAAERAPVDADTFYAVPTYGLLAKLYDWDWGGVYARRAGQDEPARAAWPTAERPLHNSLTLDRETCAQYSACHTNSKADIFTLLSSLMAAPGTRNMPQFRRFVDDVIDRRVRRFATPGFARDASGSPASGFDLSGGFQYRLCAGPIADRCDVPRDAPLQRLLTGKACSAPWVPLDCQVQSPAQMMRHPVFASLRRSLADSQNDFGTPYVYGNWPTARAACDVTELRSTCDAAAVQEVELGMPGARKRKEVPREAPSLSGGPSRAFPVAELREPAEPIGSGKRRRTRV